MQNILNNNWDRKCAKLDRTYESVNNNNIISITVFSWKYIKI